MAAGVSGSAPAEPRPLLLPGEVTPAFGHPAASIICPQNYCNSVEAVVWTKLRSNLVETFPQMDASPSFIYGFAASREPEPTSLIFQQVFKVVAVGCPISRATMPAAQRQNRSR